MNKNKIDILERAFDAQIEAAFDHRFSLPIIQTKSKLAEQLESDGYLEKITYHLGSAKVEGYALTIKGNLAYCTSDRCKNYEVK